MSFCFITHLFVPLDFLRSLQSSYKYKYAFGLSAKNSVIIFPPNSSLKRPGTFLFLPIGRSLLSFKSQLDVSNYFSTSLEISLKQFLVLM